MEWGFKKMQRSGMGWAPSPSFYQNKADLLVADSPTGGTVYGPFFCEEKRKRMENLDPSS